MPPVDRNNPIRAKSSDSRVSFMEFQREFPNDAACLAYLWRTRYSPDGEHAHCPKCDRERRFKKYDAVLFEFLMENRLPREIQPLAPEHGPYLREFAEDFLAARGSLFEPLGNQ